MQPSSDKQFPLADVFIDESSQTKHRYLLLGALTIESRFTPSLNAMIQKVRDDGQINSEMKWGRVSRSHIDTYRAFADLFFDCPTWMCPMHFHVVVVDMHQRNEHQYNEGSGELGFNKELYQLALKCWRLYPNYLFHVYPDHRTSPQTAQETRLILNRGAHKKNARRDWPFRRLHMQNSKRTLPLQLVDVLLGAAAYRINGHHEAENASPPKCDLSDYILGRANIQHPMTDTTISGKFTIWHRRLR
ncbi:DUF3800 domain-containing protein [Henriciella sp.]|uniref:DUF3800 domain-containing protein n=1 Tax=Henriciella sp. TaxID=1968823 RepID=UPI000C0E6301|nr:MAG: hypothetical protein COA64_00075 [Henriciella sp.]